MTAESVTGTTVLQERLTPDDIEKFRKAFAETGYLVFKNVVPREKLARLREMIVEAFEQAKVSDGLFAGGGLLSGHLNCFPGEQSRFIYEAVEAYGLIDLVKAITPQAVRLPNVGGNLNIPGSVAQHYHTDRPFTREFLIINTAVVDNDLINGATDVLPGTNKKFYPFWKFALQRVARRSTRVQLEQGDVIIRTSNLWHRGMPNNSSDLRPMAALTWEDGGSFNEDPFRLHDGQITFYPNWFRPTRLGRLRERIFVTAPITYSAYRFVDSLLTKKGY
ncbi:MAG TPA: phytanoyl-CoA dioxygenase family protein [Dehalococcoidia bacterium]|nr:phytanoyl-CoA dioxygenase family protein [Dehalococcoidia bacterium]